LDLPINFANIIALPLLFGVGVAFNIYFVLAWRAGETAMLQRWLWSIASCWRARRSAPTAAVQPVDNDHGDDDELRELLGSQVDEDHDHSYNAHFNSVDRYFNISGLVIWWRWPTIRTFIALLAHRMTWSRRRPSPCSPLRRTSVAASRRRGPMPSRHAVCLGRRCAAPRAVHGVECGRWRIERPAACGHKSSTTG
jgi:hypothetical protein